ncbi:MULTISPECIES: hypothetical protein [Halorussus]|uniref:hypothetical protein n=1 Tax=Halorussus TaxID=1070314 RepID=UPI0020A09CC2|nr:hypothetical protein [Halorussus vallis]USZ77030.1 hypothetical protein NGM07_06800 [Halorussus vallis]
MDQLSVSSNRVRTLAGAAALLAAAGGAAFWAWRKQAPLTRTYRRATRRRSGESDDGEPNPEREPGTDPI